MLKLQTGFGIPDTQDFVYFNHLVSPSSGITPDWHAPLKFVEDPIVGSNDVEIQILGYDAARIEASLKFASREDYFRLQAMTSQKRTLILTAGYTRFRGRVFHWLGHDYEIHDDVLLVDLVPQLRVGGTLATATFIRAASGLGVGL